MINKYIIITIGILAGICSTISFLPQVIKIIKDKETNNLSPIMFIIHLTGVILWCIYGLLVKNYIILLFNSLTLILCSIILYYIILNRYKNVRGNDSNENDSNI